MSNNSSEDLLAYTQEQATRIARADEPWTELMSAAFEAFRGETEEGAAAGGDAGPVADDADAVAADVDAESSSHTVSLPKRLGALVLLAVATVLKERAQSWVRSRRGDGSVDPESVQIYDERSDTSDAEADDDATTDETTDAEADEESSKSSGGRLLKMVAVVAVIGAVAYAFTKKRGGSDEFDEFDDYEYDDDVNVDADA